MNIRTVESSFAHQQSDRNHSTVHLASTQRSQPRRDEHSYMFITGATGFVGNVLLAELLKRGHRCMVLVRMPIEARQDKLINSLKTHGIEAQGLLQSGQLCILEGGLPDKLPTRIDHPIACVIHVAGSTQFNPGPNGEPSRTNDDGTRQLLRWMDTHGIHEMHHVSTAYVFGKSETHAPESVAETPPNFRNAYEKSKWLGERHVWEWGQNPEHQWTIYRPSIVVGDWQTGHATRFTGPYLAFAAIDEAARSNHLHHDHPLRFITARDANLNFIPVDYLAELMASIVECSGCHGRVYNIVHPDPIRTDQLVDMCERIFGIRCDHFDESDVTDHAHKSRSQRRLLVAMRHLNAYLGPPSRFDRTNTNRVEKLMSKSCPRWDEPAIGRLITYARQQDWGRTP